MAVSSRSPSPAKQNPNSRSSELNNPVRRSFSGNPFNKPSIVSNQRSFNTVTPANSPSDFGRRNSIDKIGGTSLRDNNNDEKENEREPGFKTTARVRSPSVLKGSKHFMSPTISAASKIITASPRKKVLVDRNEPVRTSAPFFSSSIDGKVLPDSMMDLCDVVVEDVDSKPEMDSKQKKPDLNQNHKSVSFDLSSTTMVEPNSVNVAAARFQISPSPSPSCSSCPIIAPLDADPSLPPYDPKTNYLSPRPQFLHYRPNPIAYLNEESLIFDSLLDTENTEEETETEEEESQKESSSEDASSVEMVKEDEEIELNVEAKGSGSAKRHFSSRLKPSISSLLLILVVACLSMISVTDTPVVGPLPVFFKDQAFISKYNDLFEIAEFAQENFSGLARKFKLWSANSLSYLSKIIHFPEEVHQLDVLQFYNLTVLQEEDHFLVDGYYSNDVGIEIGEEMSEGNEIDSWESKGQKEIEVNEDVVVADAENGSAENNIEEVVSEELESEEEVLFIPETEVSEPNFAEVEEIVQEKSDLASQIEACLQGNEESSEVPETVLESTAEAKPEVPETVIESTKADGTLASEVKPEVPETLIESATALQGNEESSEVKFEVPETVIESTAEAKPEVPEIVIESTKADETLASEVKPEVPETLIESAKAEETSELDVPFEFIRSCPKIESIKVEETLVNSGLDVPNENSKVNMSESTFSVSNNTLLGSALLALSVIAAATGLVYAKKQGKHTSNSNSSVHIKEMPSTKLVSSIPPVTTAHQERLLSSRNWATEVDMTGDCPSEMSSFQKSSSSYTKRGGGIGEIQSQEKKNRRSSKRESLATSSDYSMNSGSPSYGSFTTYEIVHNNGDNEAMVTPVRRSSRIRSQVTSP